MKRGTPVSFVSPLLLSSHLSPEFQELNVAAHAEMVEEFSPPLVLYLFGYRIDHEVVHVRDQLGQLNGISLVSSLSLTLASILRNSLSSLTGCGSSPSSFCVR